MTFKDAFEAGWGVILALIFAHLWLILLIILGIGVIRISINALKGVKEENASQKAVKAKTTKEKPLKDRTKEMLAFFLTKMDEAGNPGLVRTHIGRAVSADKVYIKRGEPSWQVRLSLPGNKWSQCIITPEGTWALIGQQPPPFDFPDAVNGPTSDVIPEWFDALYDTCNRVMRVHLPDKVDELEKIALGNN